MLQGTHLLIYITYLLNIFIRIQLEIKKTDQVSQILLLLRISMYASSDFPIIIMQLLEYRSYS